MLRKLIIMMAGLALASCATMSEEDCLSANWSAIGANDGVSGAAYSRLQTRVSECREFGIEADITAYNRGYEDGLQTYCTARNGFDVGSKGYSYNGVCPGELEPSFLAAYNEGRELHRLQSNLRSAEYALDRLYDDIDDKEDDIEDLRKNQRKEDKRLPEDEYRAKLSDLRGDLKRLRRLIDDRQFDVRMARDALNAFSYRRW